VPSSVLSIRTTMKRIIPTICLILSFSIWANEEAILKQQKIKKYLNEQIERHSQSPQWSPELKTDLPLSVNKAIAIAMDWGTKKWPQAPGLKILEVKLSQTLNVEEGVWWDYQIYILPEPYADSFANRIGSEIIISMDGVVDKERDVGTDKFVLTNRSTRKETR